MENNNLEIIINTITEKDFKKIKISLGTTGPNFMNDRATLYNKMVKYQSKKDSDPNYLTNFKNKYIELNNLYDRLRTILNVMDGQSMKDLCIRTSYVYTVKYDNDKEILFNRFTEKNNIENYKCFIEHYDNPNKHIEYLQIHYERVKRDKELQKRIRKIRKEN